MLHRATRTSRPSADSPTPGTCIRTQVPGGHLHAPQPDEPPCTYPEAEVSVASGLMPPATRPLVDGAPPAVEAATPARSEEKRRERAERELREQLWRRCGRVTTARSQPCTRWRCMRQRRPV